MARKGRGTELILKELESLTLKDQAEIKSPDYITDVVTGRKREVDISIRHKFGTHEFLTIIECRDRKRNEDATWIEQIVTKAKNIHANMIVAVSTHGFTKEAIRLAEHENVILRLLRDFKADEIREWMEQVKVGIVYKGVNLSKIDIEVEDENNKNPKLPNLKTNFEEKLIKNELGELYSFNDIIKFFCYQNPDIFDGLSENNPKELQKITIAPSNKLSIEIKDQIYLIKNIHADMECWIKPFISVSPTKTLRYEQEGKLILNKADYTFPTVNKELFMSLTKDPKTGNIKYKGNIIPK